MILSDVPTVIESASAARHQANVLAHEETGCEFCSVRTAREFQKPGSGDWILPLVEQPTILPSNEEIAARLPKLMERVQMEVV